MRGMLLRASKVYQAIEEGLEPAREVHGASVIGRVSPRYPVQ
jgi:hypothetical protein